MRDEQKNIEQNKRIFKDISIFTISFKLGKTQMSLNLCGHEVMH